MTLQDVPSELSGKIWKIHFQADAKIKAGDVLMTLECMKMEIPVLAPASGAIREILVAEDDLVSEDQILARIEVNAP